MATEYLDGVTLSTLLREDGKLEVGIACEVVRQVCSGLQALGEKNFVHRDLSPSNLFVTRAGVVKILDFGLVRLTEPSDRPEEWLTAPEATLGNPAYRAPEQHRHPGRVDPRADLYSLGCVLYHMLTGSAPFCEAGTVAWEELPARHATATPSALRSLCGEAPDALAALVERLMAKSPQDRPASAYEVEMMVTPFASPTALETRAKRLPEPEPFSAESDSPQTIRPRSNKRGARGAILLLAVAVATSAFLVLTRRAGDEGHHARVAEPRPEIPTPLTNSVAMVLVPIPAGDFLMGSPAGERGREGELESQRPVTIPESFFLSATEVTQGQYFQVTKTNPSFFSPLGPGRGAIGGLDWKRLPADSIPWQQAVDFCRLLSELPDEKKAGRTYRLPTEVEWEYACRAGTRTPFHTGRTLSTGDANIHPDPAYAEATNGPCFDRTTPVGSYRPNARGLYDMDGNVMEWTASEVTDFPNRRIIRGMAFHHSAADCRSAFRGNPAAQGGISRRVRVAARTGFACTCRSYLFPRQSDDRDAPKTHPSGLTPALAAGFSGTFRMTR